MSSKNAQSAVTYTSISSNSDRPSWGIPLMNAIHVLEPEHSEYRAPSDDDIQVEDDDDNPDEDPSEEHEPECNTPKYACRSGILYGTLLHNITATDT
nr:hypothetical protein [Tanacetum cinerariifolium]